MEIIYMWIDDEEDFMKHQSFNFSGKYHFEFVDGVLQSSLRSGLYPEQLFNIHDKKNFKLNNITAIVGENGSGKTTLLRFIMEHLSFISNGSKYIGSAYPSFKKKFLLITEEEGRLFIYKHGDIPFDYQGDISIVNGEFKKHIRFYSKEEKEYNADQIEFIIPALQETKIVYFSNVFDSKKVVNDNFKYDFVDIYLDISTNAIAYDDYHYFHSKDYQISEVLRQVRFLIDPVSTKLVRKKPDSFIVHWDKSDIDKSNLAKIGLNKSTIRLIDNMIGFLIQAEEEGILHELMREIAYIMITDYFDILNLSNRRALKRLWNQFIETEQTGLLSFLLFMNDKMKEIGYKDNYDTFESGNYEKISNSRLNLIETLKLVQKYQQPTTGFRLVIPFTESKLILELLHNCRKAQFPKRLLTFSLSGLSSGEDAMLLTYSRFYWLVDRYKNVQSYKSSGFTDGGFLVDYYKLKKNLLILIDEGELYLHPNWQREYINNLIEMLYELFHDYDEVLNIQVILTSNSPFVISDLPKEHVIMLENRDGQCRVLQETEKFDTFGANIHTLLSHAFFMSNGVMGEFAKQCINQVIELLSKDGEEISWKRVEYIIQCIGEPIIKAKLQEMYDEQRGDQFRVRRLNDEINRLQYERDRIMNKGLNNNDQNSRD
ncbi:ATP-binding cassette domain-containing protein [Paenibacillus amylolyticus]|uniref:ATP-binding cassette domain-containing protein n=1 Tax=Paenibacillus amylolyticus TaxID=1451 RepID=UPI00339A7A36